jgi:hypothetical protein
VDTLKTEAQVPTPKLRSGYARLRNRHHHLIAAHEELQTEHQHLQRAHEALKAGNAELQSAFDGGFPDAPLPQRQ